ncbi:MAG: transporter, partial [Variovorax sp.]|nr:transporter [Variovorax sp.]
MSIRQRAAWAALSLLTGGALAPAQAQVPPSLRAQPLAATITLEQVLRAARENPDVVFARQSLAAASADILAANHAPIPQLSTKLSSIDLQHGIGPGNPAQKRIDSALGVDWTWERGGKRAARTAAAVRGADAARADIDDIEAQQLIAAGGAFYDVLAAQERIVQVAAIGKSAEELAAASQRRQRAGDISQQESLRTEIESRRAQAELRAAQAERTRAALAL